MPSRKKKSPQPRSTTRVEELDTKAAEVQHYTAILVEDLKSNFNFVIEKVMSLDEKFERKLDESFNKMGQEIALVRTVVESHSVKLNRIETRLDGIDVRLDRVENKLDAVIEKVEDHDQKLKRLSA